MNIIKLIQLLRHKSIKQIMEGIKHQLSLKIDKALLALGPVCRNGLSNSGEKRVIVSLTSFPARINIVHKCIKSIINQSVKADSIVLWLAQEQFPNKEKSLPKQLLKLKQHGLSIQWYSDIRSYKKLIPTLRSNPNAVIITSDDDVYYPKHWLAGLLDYYRDHPNEVCCYRAAKISLANGQFTREELKKGAVYNRPCYLHQQTGVGGVLYPPGSFYEDICREDKILKMAPTNDDLWFWFMCILKGYRVAVLENNSFPLFYIKGSQKVSLTSINDHGDMQYFQQLEILLSEYKSVLPCLEAEYKALCLEKEGR